MPFIYKIESDNAAFGGLHNEPIRNHLNIYFEIAYHDQPSGHSKGLSRIRLKIFL